MAIAYSSGPKAARYAFAPLDTFAAHEAGCEPDSVRCRQRYFVGAGTGGGTGANCDTLADAFGAPPSQLYRSVLNKMK